MHVKRREEKNEFDVNKHLQMRTNADHLNVCVDNNFSSSSSSSSSNGSIHLIHSVSWSIVNGDTLKLLCYVYVVYVCTWPRSMRIAQHDWPGERNGSRNMYINFLSGVEHFVNVCHYLLFICCYNLQYIGTTKCFCICKKPSNGARVCVCECLFEQ